MDEFKFVLRCLAFAAFVLVITQLKTNDVSLEARLHGALVNSQVSDFVNKVSQGGVKLIKNGVDYSTEHYNLWKASGRTQSSPPNAAVNLGKPIPMPYKAPEAVKQPQATFVQPAQAQAAAVQAKQADAEDVAPVEDFE